MVLATPPLSRPGLFSWPKVLGNRRAGAEKGNHTRTGTTHSDAVYPRSRRIIYPGRRSLLYNGKSKSPCTRAIRSLSTSASSASTSHPDDDLLINHGEKIPVSDVADLKHSRKVDFWVRKWSQEEMAMAGGMLVAHLLCIFAPFTFNWAAFWVAAGLYVVTGLLGITLTYHRNLTHRSFNIPKWLEYTFAYCGVLAGQMDPISWVSIHRLHHQYCDTERDPHSPNEGFWFSHIKWLFDHDYVRAKCGELYNNVGDLKQQAFYMFLHHTYYFHVFGLAVPLYTLGGFPFVVWGLGVRIVWVLHITLLVNSACHIWGYQSWNTGDHSKNNWWMALLAFGEGWHNNHHAFEFSARQGLEWWQIDMTWYVIKFLQALGLATDVKLPSNIHRQKMAL